MAWIKNIFLSVHRFIEQRRLRKKLKELRKKDPFIYK